MKLKNYIDFISGKRIGRRFITEVAAGNIPYICGCDIKIKQHVDIPQVNNYITHDTAKLLNLDLASKGDILFVKSGNEQGHICLIHSRKTQAYYNSDEILCIRTHKKALSMFMYFLIGIYVKNIKKEEDDENKDLLYTPEKILQAKVPFYSLKEQNVILCLYKSLIDKEKKANLMIDDIMQDLVYMYRSYFDSDTSEKVTIGSTLKRYLRLRRGKSNETEEYNMLHICKDLEATDGQTFDDLYNSIKSKTQSFTEDFQMHQDCVYICIDGNDIGECGLYHRNLSKKSIYFALTPTEKYPALYLYFILSFHSCLTKSEETNNQLVILPSSIENYPLSTDYDRIAQFSKAVEEPINDINGIIEDINSMREIRNSIFKDAFYDRVNIIQLKKEIYKYYMYR